MKSKLQIKHAISHYADTRPARPHNARRLAGCHQTTNCSVTGMSRRDLNHDLTHSRRDALTTDQKQINLYHIKQGNFNFTLPRRCPRTRHSNDNSKMRLFVGCLLAYHPSNVLVYLSDRSAKKIVRVATLRHMLQIKLFISPTHTLLTLGQTVPALTLYHQAPGKVETGVPIFSHWYDSTRKKSPRGKRESNPGLQLSRRTS